MKKAIHFTLNGCEISVEVESHKMLLQVLRDNFQLTGTKDGCGQGECGACTVIVDGDALNSCIYPIFEVEGKSATTIEGIVSKDGTLHPLQKVFVEHGAIQCGFCTPGMIMAAKALLDKNPKPNEIEIRSALSGNLCRCTGYVKIIDAVKTAKDLLREG